MDDKIIVTNRAALTAKYGTRGVTKIRKAITDMIAADKKRGIKTRLVYLDDAVAMRRYRGQSVTSPGDTRENKVAIDAIFDTVNPEYLVILGAPDVIPHQDIKNPMFKPPDDPDRYAYGDLPYACDAPYSRDIAAFKGPTRVVGRVPDLRGASEPSYLLAILASAAKYVSRDVKDYSTYFGLSTHAWRKSTEMSLYNIFGDSAALDLSPPSGPKHPARQLAHLSHFINCHGAPSDSAFYGQKGRSYPESLTSKALEKKVSTGTVAAVECCYGAELYDSVILALPLPICQRYLLEGAYGYFGSSTIAYGPPEGNGAADLITQYFLLAMLEGASTGRAALMARQQFIQQVGELDPVDLKTLAQFSLLGDPSIHPVSITSPTGIPVSIDPAEGRRAARRRRRENLKAMGDFLHDSKPTASRKTNQGKVLSTTVRKALANIARVAGIDNGKLFTSFDVKTPSALRRRGRKGSAVASRYHVAVKIPDRRTAGAMNLRVVAVARELDGRIVGYRIYTER